MALDSKLRHPGEESLFTASLVISLMMWLAGILFVVLYGPFVALGVLIAQGLFIANIRGNGVKVSESQFPHLHRLVVEGAQKLHIAPPEVFVMQEGGMLNAFATRLFSRGFVIIYSDLIDACRGEKQLQFIVGHELGHLAAGHLKWNTVLLPARLIPWLGAAYSRAREYTCDRCGHFLVQDPEESKRALMVLAAGGKLAATSHLPDFIAQRQSAGSFFGTMAEVGGDYPFLCNRVAAIDNFVAPGTHRPVGRSVFGLLFAPLANGRAMALPIIAMYVVVIMGAAVAMPALKQFQERSLRAAVVGQEERPVVTEEAVFDALAEEEKELPTLPAPVVKKRSVARTAPKVVEQESGGSARSVME